MTITILAVLISGFSLGLSTYSLIESIQEYRNLSKKRAEPGSAVNAVKESVK